MPLARPAIVVGVTLAMMECLNDIGAVEFFGVKTLTFSVYDTWLNRASLAGAAQISTVMLLVVLLLLLWLERRGRTGAALFDHNAALSVLCPVFGLGDWRAGLAFSGLRLADH